jgi:hypothetical protein
MIRPTLLALLPAALVAQAPAAPSLMQTYTSAKPGIEAQMKEDPDKALAMAEALIPAAPPAFDGSTPQMVATSINEWRALTSIYRTASDAAYQAGQIEKGREYAVKAQANAKATYEQGSGPLSKLKETWAKAVADAQKAMDDEKALDAKTDRTPDEQKHLDFLKANHATFENNLAMGSKAMAYQDKSIQDLKDEPADYDKVLSVIDARLKDEAAAIEKEKGDKAKYAADGLASITRDMDKEKALLALRRFRVLDPSNKDLTRKIDFLLGKGPDLPAKPSKAAHHKKAKG